ncbi:MAG: Calx-beta domain-containing protein [Planctomycetia bacterium]|nr:Calx-beta domain-containing protein [Planctomycetia bacterium]
MQSELRAMFPLQQVNILGVNEEGQEADFDLIDEDLPIVQDVDANSDLNSDVWTSWEIEWRDVVILNAANVVTDVYNLTNNSLANVANYATLKQMFVDALTDNARPSPPTSIDLLPEADSGGSSTDNLTNFNNTDAAHALRLRVGGVIDSATVNVFAGATLIGTGTASGGTVDIITNGTVPLADGAISLTATQQIGSSVSDASPAQSITIDATTPVISSAAVTAASVGVAYSYDVQSADESVLGLTYLLATPPAGMTINQDTGVISWTPSAAQLGNASVTVQAVDAAGNTGTQSFTVAVTTTNDPPGATDDTGATDEDTALSIAAPGVLTNDTDPDASDTLTVTAFDAVSAQGATVVVNANGSYAYDPRASAILGALNEGQTLEDAFTYTVSDGQGGQDIATVRITVTGKADAPPPTASVSDVSIAEGNSGQSNLVFTVTLSAAATNVVTVNYATDNVTATAGTDYTLTSGTLTFAIGETSKTISVPIVGDTTDEPNETFELDLSAPVNATLADAQATGTITDDDPLPTVSIAGTTVTEGDSGTVNATLTVTLSNPSSQAVTVAYQSQNGTATAPGDYTTTSGTLTFAAGETSKTISVPIAVDAATESSEAFTVVLSAPTNSTLGTATGTVTITDDDGPGALQFSATSYTVDEAAGTVTITVTRTGGDAAGVTVQYATSNGAATAGSDYTTASATLTFAAGETQKTLTVPILVDAVLEQEETFTLTLSAPGGGGTLGTPSTATVRITEIQETPTESLVTQAYEDLLGREPEDAGLQFYADQLEDGRMNEFQMATAMQNSIEYRTRQIQAMYQKYLGRGSDTAGLSAHLTYLAAGGTWDGLRTTFLGSNEYYRRAGGSANAFLAALYRDVMGRAIDPVGQSEFGRLLRNEDRDTVAKRLLATDEAQNKKVTDIYDALLDRSASAGEVDFYADLLSRGMREEQVVSAFVASPEYDA